MELSFKLPDEFIEQYKNIEPNWGFPIGGGNSLSELTFYTKYSRLKEDGTKERWYEACRRVVEGFMSILKDHCIAARTHWNENKALATAKDAYVRAFNFLWSPPGRGIQHMGTELVNGRSNSSFLQNCAIVSSGHISPRSKKEAIFPFVTLMEMCLCGIGVSFDTDGAGKLTIYEPSNEIFNWVVPDSREGWAESLGVLLVSYFFQNQATVEFDYSEIRLEGAPIRGFGGIAPGPAPLIRCHEQIRKLFSGRNESKITSTDIVDIMNIAGKAVVSGGNRRTAELALGESDDKEFLNLKNWEINPERMGQDGWGQLSNNSIKAEVGKDYSYLIDNIILNGEPGLVWLDQIRKYGRLNDLPDYKDSKAIGVNPCFRGDTLIAVADGRGAVQIKQLAEEGKDVPVYSMNESGNIEIKWGRNPRLTGQNKQLLEIVFDSGSSLFVTPNHKFILKNGVEKRADELIKNDSLPRFTKRAVKMSTENPKLYLRVGTDIFDAREGVMEHRLIAKFNNLVAWDELYNATKKDGWAKGGLVVHHKDFNSMNNSSDNLEIMTFDDHRELHAKLADMSGENNPMWGREHKDSTKKLIGKKSTERWATEEFRSKMEASGIWSEENRKASSRRMSFEQKARNKKYFLEQEKITDLQTIWIDDNLNVIKNCEVCKKDFIRPWGQREQGLCSIICNNKQKDNIKKRREGINRRFIELSKDKHRQQIEIYLDLLINLGRDPERVEWMAECRKRGVPYRLGFANRKNKEPSLGTRIPNFASLKEMARNYNHRVVEVRNASSEDVYNITVDDNHTVAVITELLDNNAMSGILTTQCGEQPLFHTEACTLGETYPTRHETLEDFHRTLKVAYLYTKAVTLLSTPWPETNEVMQRNRRIGLSMSGLAQFIEDRGWQELRRWMDSSFQVVKERDIRFSEWLGIRESIRFTTVKPSGTTGLVCGVTPGVHWPTNEIYIRRMRFQKNNILVPILKKAGYHIEPDVVDPEFTVVVEFPTRGPNIRTEREVTIWEKVALAVTAQAHWSNNAVSCTATFMPEEADQIAAVLRVFDGQLKTISFLPITDDGAYQQMPYEGITNERYNLLTQNIKSLDWTSLYGSGEDIDVNSEAYCSNDHCELPKRNG